MERELDLFSTLAEIVRPEPSTAIFHNTTGLTGDKLKERQIRAGSQNDKVLNLLRSHPDQAFTPWDVVRALNWPERMKVSAGRSLTDLTRLGYLRTTGIKRMECCGEENNEWIYLKK